jgi:hypothetical protein
MLLTFVAIEGYCVAMTEEKVHCSHPFREKMSCEVLRHSDSMKYAIDKLSDNQVSCKKLIESDIEKVTSNRMVEGFRIKVPA